MSWRDRLAPARMERVGLIAPVEEARAMLRAVALSASVELELPHAPADVDNELDRALACGELSRLEGYALAGVDVRAAETAEEILQQWGALKGRAAVVILTRRSAQTLGETTEIAGAPMTVVLPE